MSKSEILYPGMSVICFAALWFLFSCGEASSDEKKAGGDKKDTLSDKVEVRDSSDKENSKITDTILIRAMGENGRYGYQDTIGNWRIEPQFKLAGEFTDVLTPVSKDGTEWELIDRNGKVAMEFDEKHLGTPIVGHNELSGEDFVISPTEGFLPVNMLGGKQGFLRLSDKKAGGNYDEVSVFSQGIAAVRTGEKWGFIRTDGSELVKPAYDDVFAFSCNRALINHNGQCWFIDRQLKTYSFKKKFKQGFRFKEGLSFISYNDDYTNYQLIDTMGNVVNKGPYEYIYNLGFENGECEVMKNGKCIIIDKKGNKIRDKKDGCQEGC